MQAFQKSTFGVLGVVAADRKYEQAFVEGVEFHNVDVGTVIVNGDRASVEWALEFTHRS